MIRTGRRIVVVLLLAALGGAGCGLAERPSRDEAVARLDEAQVLVNELFVLAEVDVPADWVSEFRVEDNGCKITCRECGEATRFLDFEIANHRAQLQASLAAAADTLGGAFRTSNPVGETDFFDALLRGPSGREHLASVAISSDRIKVQLGNVCYR